MTRLRHGRQRLSTLVRAVAVTLRPASRRDDVRVGLVTLLLVALGLLVPQYAEAVTPSPTVTATIGNPSVVAVPSTVLNPKHQPNDALDVIPAGTYDSTSLQDATSATGPWMVFWPTGTS